MFTWAFHPFFACRLAGYTARCRTVHSNFTFYFATQKLS